MVITTVGPYTKYGLPLVAACAEAGTDYADLTGETMFIRESIDLYHKQAVDTGARIVHSCGFDSIPSDLTVYALYKRALADGTGELGETNFVLRGMAGGVSGGTVASMIEMMQTASTDPEAATRDERPLHADHRPSGRARAGASVRHPVAARARHRPRAGRHLDRCLPHGCAQLPNRPPQQRIARLGLRRQVSLPRDHERRFVGGRARRRGD